MYKFFFLLKTSTVCQYYTANVSNFILLIFSYSESYENFTSSYSVSFNNSSMKNVFYVSNYHRMLCITTCTDMTNTAHSIDSTGLRSITTLIQQQMTCMFPLW